MGSSQLAKGAQVVTYVHVFVAYVGTPTSPVLHVYTYTNTGTEVHFNPLRSNSVQLKFSNAIAYLRNVIDMGNENTREIVAAHSPVLFHRPTRRIDSTFQASHFKAG